MPIRLTVCGLPESGLSPIVSLATRFPLALGSKLTEIAQFDPEPRVLPQVLDHTVKSVALGPVMLRPLIVTVPDSLLVRVTTCGTLVVSVACFPKSRLLGETDGPGVGIVVNDCVDTRGAVG